MKNLFKEEWDKIDKPETHPRSMRNAVKCEWEEFRGNVLKQDPKFVKDFVSSLYAGDIYILKDSYPREFCHELKNKAFDCGKSTPQSFHKVFEGSPDFHRVVDQELAKHYSFMRIKHHYYFYRWNGDPLNIWGEIDSKWGIFKFLGGFRLDEYVSNRPKEGIVDRIHIHHYPSGAGEIETHSDPYKNQRTIMGAQMSEKGTDFKSGGLYFIDKKGEKVNVEDEIKLGYSYIAFTTVHHGVEIIDAGTKVDWNNHRGRWFLGFYSLESDEVKDRHTGYAVRNYTPAQK